MIEETVIPIDFGQGVDTKTDPKMVVAGKMLRLENATFTAPKRIQKRNGYDLLPTSIAGYATLVNPKLVHSYNDELIAADQGLLLSYSQERDTWINRGPYISTDVIRTSIDQDTVGSGYVDSAIFGNYALYGWSTNTQPDNIAPFAPAVYSSVYGSVVDINTGSIVSTVSGENVASNVLLSTTTSLFNNQVRCVNIGGTTLAIIYLDPTASFLYARTVSFSGSNVVFSSEQTISTSFVGYSFDVVATSTGAIIYYTNGSGTTIARINSSLMVTASVTISDAGAEAPLFINEDASGNIWAYWTKGSKLILRYAVYDSSLVQVLAPTTLYTGVSPAKINNIIAIEASPTAQSVFFGVSSEITLSVPYTIDQTRVVTADIGGLPSVNNMFLNGLCPYSRPFKISQDGITDTHAFFIYRGIDAGLSNSVSEQATLFIVRIDSVSVFPIQITSQDVPYTALRVGSGVSASSATIGRPDTVNKSNNDIAYTPNVSFLSSLKILFACGLVNQSFDSDIFANDFITVNPGLVGEYAYAVDFNSIRSNISVNSGQLSVLNGGVIQIYDGGRCTELGFHLFPEIIAEPTTDASGSIAAGTYSYLAIFQWTDNQGNLHQSAPSLAKQVTISGPFNATKIAITTGYLTQKKGLSVAIYRTQNNGSVYYQVNNPFFQTSSDSSVNAIYFTDLFSDAELNGNPIAYTYPGNSVLENTTPPPSVIMVPHNNRLWFVDAENPNDVWYTKSYQKLVGLSPSGFMVEQIDPKYGVITSLAEMDEKILIFKEKGMFVQSGDGVTDNGTNNSLSFPQVVPSDVGCSELKSTILTPQGVMFKSINGIYMVSRSLVVAYVGLEVESYNNQTITAASFIPTKSQIRFLCNSGLTLVYDYIFSQWSTFTNHIGNAATSWHGKYVYARTDGTIFIESTNKTDNGTGYNLLAQTSWLALASVQGFQRVRRLIMLGDYTNGADATHKIQIQAAYDFVSSFSTAIPYTFGSASSSGSFQYRERLPRQKCDSISLLIQEVNTGDNADYLDLNNISFEAGVKRGVNKLPSGQTV